MPPPSFLLRSNKRPRRQPPSHSAPETPLCPTVCERLPKLRLEIWPSNFQLSASAQPHRRPKSRSAPGIPTGPAAYAPRHAMPPQSSSIFRRAVSSAALLMQRARNRRWPNASRDIAMAAAVVFAFTTVLAYRSRVPAKPPESSTSTNAAVTTSTNAAATDPQPQLSKPMAGTDASPTSAPLSTKTATHAGTSLKRVQVGPNEVDYIGDDVTVRTFPDRSHAKRPRLSHTHHPRGRRRNRPLLHTSNLHQNRLPLEIPGCPVCSIRGRFMRAGLCGVGRCGVGRCGAGRCGAGLCRDSPPGCPPRALPFTPNKNGATPNRACAINSCL